MTEGGEGAEFEVSAVVRAVLSESRNAVTLHSMVKESSFTYVMTFAEGKDAESVMSSLPTEATEWMETFAEAWQAASDKIMPGFIAKRCAVWAGADEKPGTPPTTSKPVKKTAWSSGGALAMAPSAASGDEALAEMMAGLVVSDHDVPKAIDDIQKQGISGARILALSLALMSGHVHPMGDSAELRYASDLRLCPLIRQQRKAGVLSLDDVVKAKNKRDLFLHYTRLAKEYNDRRMIEEATLVSQFWAETSAAFEGDDAGLFVYVTEWNRTYGGRGIPKLLDTDLILRHRKHVDGGASSSEVKEMKEALKVAKAAVTASDDRSSAILKRLQKLEAATPGGGLSDKTCFICGGNHLARNCPSKDGGKGDPSSKSNGKGKKTTFEKKEETKEESD